MRTFIKIVLVLSLVVTFASSVNAQLQFELDDNFNPPSSSGNAIATISNVDNDTVSLYMDISNFTTSTEGILGWYFNFTGTVDDLSFQKVGGAMADDIIFGSGCSSGNPCKADGDGTFDMVFMFPDVDGLGIDEGGSSWSRYEISSSSEDITFNNFMALSTGGNKGAYGSAVQVNDISGDGGTGGWMGDGTTGTIVPEPISSTLFIVGAATLGFRRFRKK